VTLQYLRKSWTLSQEVNDSAFGDKDSIPDSDKVPCALYHVSEPYHHVFHGLHAMKVYRWHYLEVSGQLHAPGWDLKWVPKLFCEWQRRETSIHLPEIEPQSSNP
jgi:hypothetical protein